MPIEVKGILVTETLRRRSDAYGPTAEVFDVKKKDDRLIRLELNVQRSASDSDDAPVVIKDSDSGLSLIVKEWEGGRISHT